MLEACLKVLSWLEESGYVPEVAREDIECAKENLEDSLTDFLRTVS